MGTTNKNNNFFKKNIIFRFIESISEEQVSIYSAQTSFFILLSLFPLIMLFLNAISLTSLSEASIPYLINKYSPDYIRPLLTQIVTDMMSNSSGTILSITAIIALWSGSKGALAIIYGTRKIFNSTKSTNYFVLKISAILYTFSLIVTLAITLVLLVFGNSIFKYIAGIYPVLLSFDILYTLARYIIVLFILTFFFVSVYWLGSDDEYTWRDLMPGALFSSIGWMIFSYLFSVYIDNFNNFSYMYGSLTAIIIIMFWLYFCMYIMFIGALFNRYLYQHQ